MEVWKIIESKILCYKSTPLALFRLLALRAGYFSEQLLMTGFVIILPCA